MPDEKEQPNNNKEPADKPNGQVKEPKQEVGYIKPREITDEIQESYLAYAMSVIVSRALPDVRDGLKPVHRRILYAMNEMGLRHNVKFRKSATVVGEVLGKYHPHGDVAVYDSLVRMAQDFSLRYPLIQGQGNFGSIDGDGPAAQRYCITGDSFVVTNRCIEKIGEVSNQEDIALDVLSFEGKVNHASKLFDSGVHPIIEVETLRGFSLRGTTNHPILTMQKDSSSKPVFQWKLLSNIEKGDFAVIDRNKKVLWPEEEPLLKSFYPETRGRKFKIYKMPKKMSPDLAFLLGIVLAEGFISFNKEKHYAKIGICNTDKLLIEEFIKKFKKLFPDCAIYQQTREPLSYGKKKFISLEVCSYFLAEFFENLGLKAVPSKEKEVPHIMFHAKKESVAAFLRGFVEGDGTIFGVGRKQASPEIRFISASKKMLSQMQIILLRFGIDSFLRKDGKRECWFLVLRGYDNFKDFQEIGFFDRDKNRKIEVAIKRNYIAYKEKFVMLKNDYIPFLSNYLRSKYKNKNNIPWDFREYLLKHNLDRYWKLNDKIDILKKILEPEDWRLVSGFLTNRYLFDPIIRKEQGEPERVYSFRVDSDCHSFVSNGFISHNTECRMSSVGEEILKDIEKDTVDFTANYDATKKEPTVLPSPAPQLLLNGSLGIAVGMATNIPPHNLTEVMQATKYLIDNPDSTTEDLLQFVKGPDFPTGGIIYGKKDIAQAYSQGKGPIVVRGKTEVDENKKGYPQITITEIPYQVQKSSLVQQFAKLVEDKRIDGVKDIRDESDREGMHIVIELKKEAFPKKILNALFKYSDLQKTFHLNMLALVDGIQPKVLSLVDVLTYYLKHKQEVVIRRIKFDLEKAKQRVHILDGLMIALKNIDEVIKVIKKSESREAAKQNLIERFKLSDVQAVAILEMRLQNLAKLEQAKIEEELLALKKIIAELESILKSEKKIKDVMKKELIETEEKHKDERRTKVVAGRIGEIGEEDLIPNENAIILLTQGGYVKRMKPSFYKIQKRGGAGVSGADVASEDAVEHFLLANNLDKLLFFADTGKVFQCLAWEIPELKRASKGRGILNFLETSQNEKVLSLISYTKQDEEEGKKYLVIVTKQGIIKRTDLVSFKNVRKNGLLAINLQQGDTLRGVLIAQENDEIFLATKLGQSIRFTMKDVRAMGRSASGVRGIRLETGDEVVGMSAIQNQRKEQQYLLVVMENGYGKRTKVEEYRLQKRGGTGIKAAKVNEKTGKIVFAKVVGQEEKEIIVISSKGQVIRSDFKSISIIGRASSGVRIMRLKPGDKVASGICLQEIKELAEDEK